MGSEAVGKIVGVFGLEPAATDAMELRVVHDHIIVGKNGHASLKGMKLI